MSILPCIPFGSVLVKPHRPRSLLSMPEPVLRFMSLLSEKSTYPAAIHKEISISARCLADAKNHGVAELVEYWQDIICEQHSLLLRRSRRALSLPGRGRPQGRYRETDGELDDEIRKGFNALRLHGESISSTLSIRRTGLCPW